MSDTPASWQPDPTGRHDHRYWDGTQWTEHVADAGVAATDPYDEAAGSDPTEAAAPTPTGWSTTPEPSATTDEPAATADEPAATEAFRTTGAPATGDADADTTDAPSTDDADTTDVAPSTDAPSTDTGAGAGTGSTWGTPSAPAASGWALPDEPTPSVSGWGAAADAPTTEPEAPAGEEPTSTWATGATTWDAPTEGAATTADDDATATTPAASGWGDPTAAIGATPTATSWGGSGDDVVEALTAPAPPVGPTTDEPPGEGKSRKVLILVLALLVIAGVVVGLVLLSGDDDDGTGSDVADRISEALQEDLDLDDADADCIGEHITDEIGASRLEDVDFDAPEPPAELEADFNEAFEAAIGACDLSPSDLVGGGDGAAEDEGDASGDGADEGDEAGADIEDALDNPEDAEEFATLLAESYSSTLGIDAERSRCLADRMVEAVQSGEVSEEDAFGEFFEFLEDCQISLEDLSPPTG